MIKDLMQKVAAALAMLVVIVFPLVALYITGEQLWLVLYMIHATLLIVMTGDV
jgi:hypothetical protein